MNFRTDGSLGLDPAGCTSRMPKCPAPAHYHPLPKPRPVTLYSLHLISYFILNKCAHSYTAHLTTYIKSNLQLLNYNKMYAIVKYYYKCVPSWHHSDVTRLRERWLHFEAHSSALLCVVLTPKPKRISTIPMYKNLKYIQNRNIETQISYIHLLTKELSTTWYTESAYPTGTQTARNQLY